MAAARGLGTQPLGTSTFGVGTRNLTVSFGPLTTRRLTFGAAPVNLPRVARQYAEFTITATLPDGSEVAVTAADVALLAPRRTPDADTTWTPAEVDAGTVAVLLAGPDVDPGDGLVVPLGGADLWARVTDIPEISAARVSRVTVT